MRAYTPLKSCCSAWVGNWHLFTVGTSRHDRSTLKADEGAVAKLTQFDRVSRVLDIHEHAALANGPNRRTERRHGLGFQCRP
jgi:hypothetical protein